MTETATQHKNNVEWGQAKGFSKYLISTDGQVYSLKSDRLLPQGFTHRGYKQVDVCNDEGIKKHMRVHRLVYMAHKGVMQMVPCDGQCCGAKRPRCGAERPPFSLI